MEEVELYNNLKNNCKYSSLIKSNNRLVALCSEGKGTNSPCSFLFLRENDACVATEFYLAISTMQTRINPEKIIECPYRK